MEGLMQGPTAIWMLLPVWLRGLIRGMRPRQWSKNGLIFLPILFDRQLTHLDALLRVGVGFIVFCLASSAIYLLNDIVDVERDKLHPKKRFRAIASGQLPMGLAIAAAVVLPVISVGVALTYSPALAIILVIYLAKQVAYSFWLKHVVVVDVMLLAAGYVLRVIAGVVVITVTHFSPWLYVCTGALSLFLAVAKRRQELIMLGKDAEAIRPSYKDYNLPLLDDMLRIVITSAVISYTLYTVEANTSFGGPAMLLTVPFVLYGVFRYLYLMHVKGVGGAPDEVLFKDKPLLIDIILYLMVAGTIIYLAPRIIQ